MPRAPWPAASLILISQAVAAAQGVHPGPLPAPIGSDSAASTAPAASPRYADPQGYGSGPGYGPAVDPREAADRGYGWGGGHGAPGLPTTPPGRGYDGGGYSYPRPAASGGQTSPRGYWQWVPAEPGGADGYDYGRGTPAYTGFDDTYGPQGYGAPPSGGYGQTYPDASASPSYEAFGQPYPGFGAYPGHQPDGHYAAPGYYPEPPGGGRDTRPPLVAPGAPAPRPAGGQP